MRKFPSNSVQRKAAYRFIEEDEEVQLGGISDEYERRSQQYLVEGDPMKLSNLGWLMYVDDSESYKLTDIKIDVVKDIIGEK